MEKPHVQRYERNLEHFESIYRQLIVELIHLAGKDWYPQNPELFRFNGHSGLQISYEDVVLLQSRSKNHSLLKIEAAALDYLLLPLQSYHSLAPQLREKVANGEQLSIFSPQEFGVYFN